MHRQIARTAQLQNSEFLDQTQKRGNLTFVAGQFRDQIVMPNADDLRPEQFADLNQLRAIIRSCLDFHENQLTRNRLSLLEIMDLYDVDQLLQLLGDLVQNGIVAPHDRRYARDLRVVGRRDIERVDIEATTAKQAGNAGEYAEFIFYEYGDGVSHC